MGIPQVKNTELRIRLLEEELRIVRNELELAHIRIQELTILAQASEGLLFPQEWGLSATESGVLRCLLDVTAATKEALMTFLYASRPDDPPHDKIVDVYVHKVRSKLRKVNAPVVIETIWGQGYALTKESKEYIRSVQRRA